MPADPRCTCAITGDGLLIISDHCPVHARPVSADHEHAAERIKAVAQILRETERSRPFLANELDSQADALVAELAAVRQQLADYEIAQREARKRVERDLDAAEAALRETRQALVEGANVLAMIHQPTHPKRERPHCQICALIARMEALAAAGAADDAKEQNRWWEDGYDPIPAAEGSAP